MLGPRFAHRAIQLLRRTAHHLRDEIRDEQSPAMHRDLRHAAGRGQRHVRLPFARFAIEALHLSVALTRHQQVALMPRHACRTEQPPAITLGHIQPCLHFPAIAQIKAQHIAAAARHACGNEQPPLGIEKELVRGGQPADDRSHMRSGIQVVALHFSRAIHQDQHICCSRRRGEHQ